ncbi:MAG: multiheme c-type cytochrome [Isosphaeraceae bacterium]|nr:multiheme c-type cytochrome [Isosphaeraceae bacterium]
MSSRGRISGGPLAVPLGLGLLLLALTAPGQDERPRPAGVPAKVEKLTVSAKECGVCHASPEKYADDRGKLICEMNEASVWEREDKHKDAYNVLLGPRGQAIGRALGGLSGMTFDVTKERACLNCHATPVYGIEPSQFDQKENGVSCIVCHGAGQEWIALHPYYKRKQWRQHPRKVREEAYGMTDLWDPVRRAETCAACHIGKADLEHPEEGKVLTHAMYAAGHPPLPGFEAATFCEAQPRHWRFLREKTSEVQAFQGYNPAKRERTELVAAGGVVALRTMSALFAAQTRSEGAAKPIGSAWPDFARYDCYNCHHDLRRPSWRQARGYEAPPGRPLEPSWTNPLVRLGVALADPARAGERMTQYRAKLKRFHGALGARPFGDRAEAGAAAQDLADWTDALLSDLRRGTADPRHVGVDGPGALGLLHLLCREARDTWDYDAAREVAWAFRTIFEEAQAFDPKAVPDPKVPEILKQLDAALGLTLRPDGPRGPLENTLAGRLKVIADYDPRAFHALFAELAQRLPPDPAPAR